ncbi:hypothetical protein IAR55_004378 [Kwoniella newhampshirensis]|uniref:Uncharacterized protein n=1 Tax=Kwoniella newhampshirensis TaxID=1651941 RepID=A0AAW0Z0H2_9TREE
MPSSRGSSAYPSKNGGGHPSSGGECPSAQPLIRGVCSSVRPSLAPYDHSRCEGTIRTLRADLEKAREQLRSWETLSGGSSRDGWEPQERIHALKGAIGELTREKQQLRSELSQLKTDSLPSACQDFAYGASARAYGGHQSQGGDSHRRGRQAMKPERYESTQRDDLYSSHDTSGSGFVYAEQSSSARTFDGVHVKREPGVDDE